MTKLATLYKRAIPSQVKVLRIVEGAIKNACHAHPQHSISKTMDATMLWYFLTFGAGALFGAIGTVWFLRYDIQ